MSQPRFYCSKLTPGVVTLGESESRHALHSRRLSPGDEVVLFDGHGRMARAVLQTNKTDKGGRPRGPGGRPVSARFAVERVLCEPPPTSTLTLLVAACKGPRLNWMVEKLTELGTTRVVIAEFERSVVHVGPAHAAKLRRVALEAARQSERVWLPEISCGDALAELLPNVAGRRLLVAHPRKDAPALSHRLHALDFVDRDLSAVVGPEGGLTEAELRMLQDAGGEIVRLALTILRVETAAVAVAANWAAHQAG